MKSQLIIDGQVFVEGDAEAIQATFDTVADNVRRDTKATISVERTSGDYRIRHLALIDRHTRVQVVLAFSPVDVVADPDDGGLASLTISEGSA